MPPPGALRQRPDQVLSLRKRKNSELWKWMFSYLGQYKRKFTLLLMALFILTGLGAYLPTLSKIIIDEGILALDTTGDAWQSTIRLITIYGVIMAIVYLGTGIVDYSMGKIGTNVVASIRNDIFENVQNMSMDYFDQMKTGDIISRATNDVDELDVIFGGQFAIILATIFQAVLIVILMLLINWRLALLSFTMLPVMMILMHFIKPKVQKAFMKTRRKISNLTRITEQNISGMKEIQGFGRQREAFNDYERANRENQQAFLYARKLMSFLIPLMLFIANFFVLWLIGIGALSIIGDIVIFQEPITIGDLSAFSTYLTQLIFPVIMLSMFMAIAEGALASADRICEILNQQNSLLDPEDPHSIEEIKGEIAFRNVTFQYKERELGKKEPLRLIDPVKGEKILRRSLLSVPGSKSILYTEYLEKLKNRDRTAYELLLSLDPRISLIFVQQEQQIREDAMAFLLNLSNEDLEPFLPQFLTTLKAFGKLPKETQKTHSIKESLQYAQKLDEILEDPLFLPLAAKEVHRRILQEEQAAASVQEETPEEAENETHQEETFDKRELLEQQLQGMARRTLIKILSDPKIPKEISDEFPESVKRVIHVAQKQEGFQVGPVLKDVSFEIQPGKTAAFVGETGAGKSTIIKLIARFYDLQENMGEILIDGVNIKDFKKEELRKLIGMVPQDNFTFSGTILENLSYGLPMDQKLEVNEELLNVARYLGLHDFVMKEPQGYYSYLQEQGKNLSVGQRQLICLARVLLTDPKILILDEATSSIDPFTEKVIQNAIDKVRENRTTIIIAHRLSTIRDADEIFVMGDGKIIEHGSHEELMEMGGIYSNLVHVQKGPNSENISSWPTNRG